MHKLIRQIVIGKSTSGSISTLSTVFAYKGVVFQPLIRMGISPPRPESGNEHVGVFLCDVLSSL